MYKCVYTNLIKLWNLWVCEKSWCLKKSARCNLIRYVCCVVLLYFFTHLMCIRMRNVVYTHNKTSEKNVIACCLPIHNSLMMIFIVGWSVKKKISLCLLYWWFVYVHTACEYCTENNEGNPIKWSWVTKLVDVYRVLCVKKNLLKEF